jgi:flagellar hook-length control protein FliK
MLAQINAAQVIDTSVKNNSHGGAELIDKNDVKINIKPEDKLAPIVINLPSDEIVDDAAILQAQNAVGAESAGKTAADSSPLGTQSIATAATAGESETVKNEQAVAKPSDKPTDSTGTKASIDASVLALLSKDDNAIKADKLLANLTPSQQGELATELDAMSKPINKDNVADLKQLLSKYVSESEKPQTPQQAINAQISTLTTPEKQALLNQLQGYIKSEPIPTKELTLLKGVISDLETAINADTLSSAKDKPLFANNTLIAGVTPKTQQGTESANVKPELKSESSKSIAETPEELTKQLDVLQKESMRATNAEQMPPRAAQIFSQIINIFDKSSLNTIAKYDTLGYEQAIIEAQSLQAGQLQSTAQAKQVSIDPATLQALNIIKSDAAKMLQERVTSMLSINNKEAEIRLDPPEMGSMQIRIRSDAEQAQINFVVQNQQAKEALEQSLPRLRELLMQQGLELGESSISYGGSSPEQNEQQEGQPQGQMANNSSSDETNSEQPDKQTHSSGQQTSSSIDYYA